MLKKNQIEKIEINGITSEGSGVGRVDGMAVFVPDTAVGDKLDVKIVKVNKSYAYGIIEKIIEPSKDRQSPDCDVFKRCGGCSFRHISYEAELRIKETTVKDAFKRLGKIDTPVDEILGCESPYNYRNKAQYPVAEVNGKAVCGFYSKRSHRVAENTDCKIQPIEFKAISDKIMTYINENNIPAYNEVTQEGTVRHIYMRKGFHTGQIMVCIIVAKKCQNLFHPLCGELAEQFPEIKSMMLNVNLDNTNIILGSKSVVLWGRDYIEDVMCGNKIKLSLSSFYQVNTHQAERMYAIAEEYANLDTDKTLLDLYCGTGTIGLSMAHKVKQITGVEIVSEAVDDAEENARLNGIKNAEFICSDAGEAAIKFLDENRKIDVVIVDPPRKGCDQLTLDSVLKIAPERIIMISCNPATAARDCAILRDGGYIVEKIRPVDMFPGTTHVESVVLMSRVNNV